MATRTEEKMGRRDIHRPAEFNPADYVVVDYLDNKPPSVDLAHLFELGGIGARAASEVIAEATARHEAQIFRYFPDWRTGGDDHRSIFQCNHCGTQIRWVAVVRHRPTGRYLAFGEICAERCELPSRDAFRAKFIKTQAELERIRLENEAKRAAFRAEHGEVVAYLEANAEEYGDGFIDSLAAQFKRKGELSEKQLEAVRRNIERDHERDERRTAEVAQAGPLPTGRVKLEGEVVSTKVKESQYGSTLKMLVKLDDGNKVWGTVPEALERAVGDWYLAKPGTPGPDARVRWEDEYGYQIEGDGQLRGKRVRLTATVEASRDDEHFGFFKRPTGAEVL